MNSRSQYRAATSFIAAISALLFSHAGVAEDYVRRVSDRHKEVVVVMIESALSISAGEGTPCFYTYRSRVKQVVRGKFKTKVYEFSSELPLTVGSRYMLYIPISNQKSYRTVTYPPQSASYKRCQSEIATPFLLSKEIHLVRLLWDGTDWKDFVHFSDAFAELDDEDRHSQTESEEFVEFDYFLDALSKMPATVAPELSTPNSN